jgi:hypothetical protein
MAENRNFLANFIENLPYGISNEKKTSQRFRPSYCVTNIPKSMAYGAIILNKISCSKNGSENVSIRSILLALNPHHFHI